MMNLYVLSIMPSARTPTQYPILFTNLPTKPNKLPKNEIALNAKALMPFQMLLPTNLIALQPSLPIIFPGLMERTATTTAFGPFFARLANFFTPVIVAFTAPRTNLPVNFDAL